MVDKINLNGLEGTNLIQSGADGFECVLKSKTDDGQEVELAYRPSDRRELRDLIKYLTDISIQLQWSTRKMGKYSP